MMHRCLRQQIIDSAHDIITHNGNSRLLMSSNTTMEVFKTTHKRIVLNALYFPQSFWPWSKRVNWRLPSLISFDVRRLFTLPLHSMRFKDYWKEIVREDSSGRQSVSNTR